MLGIHIFLKKKALIGSVSICCLILEPVFLHIEPLVSHISPRLNGLGDMKGILQSWAPHLLHIIQLILLMFYGVKKKHLQGTGAATSLKSIVYLL